MPLAEIIKNRIQKTGAISVAEFMELALCHPEFGYYMKRDPFGKTGDFITAPEISQVFGEIIGAWLARQWQLQGSPTDIALVELGAGRGTLMADALRATKNIKGFHDALSVHIIEISPSLKQKQWKTLAGKHQKIQWHETIDTLPQLPLFFVANEFFDALPIRQFEGKKEIKIILDKNNNFQFSSSKNSEISETCEPALAIIEKLSQQIKINGGAGLIIDYGYIGGSKSDTLQAIKKHKYHDIFSDIGDADITALVDFSALENMAKTTGVVVHDIMPQGEFLMRYGAGDRTTNLCKISGHEQQQALISGLKRLADPEQMGELFKVLMISK